MKVVRFGYGWCWIYRSCIGDGILQSENFAPIFENSLPIRLPLPDFQKFAPDPAPAPKFLNFRSSSALARSVSRSRAGAEPEQSRSRAESHHCSSPTRRSIASWTGAVRVDREERVEREAIKGRSPHPHIVMTSSLPSSSSASSLIVT